MQIYRNYNLYLDYVVQHNRICDIFDVRSAYD